MRHALIVGGSRGIGLATVRCLATEGYALTVVSRGTPPSVSPFGTEHVVHLQRDITEEGGAVDLVARAVERQGPLGCVVFLHRHRGPVADEWSAEMRTTLDGTRHLIDALVGQFDAEADHSIVLVGSMAGRYVATEQSLAYHVAKAALEQMGRWYAVTLGRQGIRVNAVALGAVIKQESKAFYDQHPDLVKLYADITPLGRMGRAEEVASVISFLCGSQSSFVTGHTLVVDGGLSLRWHEALAREVSPLHRLAVTRPPER